jgi:hypothetical protein
MVGGKHLKWLAPVFLKRESINSELEPFESFVANGWFFYVLYIRQKAAFIGRLPTDYHIKMYFCTLSMKK